jgi:hypothetical protein
MSRASTAAALNRAVQREQALDARGTGSARVLEAARRSAPPADALRPVSLAELASLRATAVGEAYGVVDARVSLDGRRCVLLLGGSK